MALRKAGRGARRTTTLVRSFLCEDVFIRLVFFGTSVFLFSSSNDGFSFFSFFRVEFCSEFWSLLPPCVVSLSPRDGTKTTTNTNDDDVNDDRVLLLFRFCGKVSRSLLLSKSAALFEDSLFFSSSSSNFFPIGDWIKKSRCPSSRRDADDARKTAARRDGGGIVLRVGGRDRVYQLRTRGGKSGRVQSRRLHEHQVARRVRRPNDSGENHGAKRVRVVVYGIVRIREIHRRVYARTRVVQKREQSGHVGRG